MLRKKCSNGLHLLRASIRTFVPSIIDSLIDYLYPFKTDTPAPKTLDSP